MGRIQTLTICCSVTLAFVPLAVHAQSESPSGEEAFGYEERSTLETIQFDSIEEETLANTVIEGGLAAPAAGVPLRALSADDSDSYMDPLALEPRDSRTERGRNERQAEFELFLPRENVGQPAANMPLTLPSNRTYQTLNINMTERP